MRFFIYWLELDGLLTETGRSVEGNWTTLDGNLTVYWWKLDGLLAETGRIIDGNWTFSWRKLDGLDTETGWSIDGDWIVIWRKLDGLLLERVKSIDGSRPADFHHLGNQKMRFCRVLKPTVSWTPRILQLIFCILEARKCDICRFVKPLSSMVRIFVWANFTHFGILKMRFPTISETNVSRYFAKGIDNFSFLRPEHANMSSLKNPRFKATKLCVSKFFAYWWTEKAISADSWNQYF